MLTYQVGYAFSLTAPLKAALAAGGWHAGKLAQLVEESANEALETAQIVVPKAGTKAASKEAVKLRSAKVGSTAIVAGVRYSVSQMDATVQRVISLNDALRELESEFELEDTAIDLPDWLSVWLSRVEKSEVEAGRSLRA